MLNMLLPMPNKTERAVPPNRQVRTRLRILMARHGLTQRQLASKMDVSEGAVSMWLSGATGISGPTARRMAELFKEDPEWILGHADTGDTGFSAAITKLERNMSPEGMVKLVEYASENPGEIEAIIDALLARKRD